MYRRLAKDRMCTEPHKRGAAKDTVTPDATFTFWPKYFADGRDLLLHTLIRDLS